jgi:hypothetical protein
MRRLEPSMQLRSVLLTTVAGLVVVVLAVAAIAAGGPESSSAAGQSGSPQCVPDQLNRSAVLPGTTLSVAPLPGSYDASAHTQISIVGAPPSDIRDVRVSGSQSGSHSGHLAPYSQGDGASFVPSGSFKPGERVTVRGSELSGKSLAPFAYSFVVAREDYGIYSATAAATATPAAVERDYNEMQHFQSAPTLKPPVLVVTAHSPQASNEDVFSSPYSGPGPNGLMIFNEAGALVWFDPLPSGVDATNLQVQQLDGAPVLTWWQGAITVQGFGQGEEMIDNASYKRIGTVHAGNGLKADLHDFRITPQGTALLTVFNPIECNLSAYGGPSNGSVTDAIIQELDLETGLVRREWHSLDHVSPSESYSAAYPADGPWPYDYFHVNSIDPLSGERLLISARNTSALYELSTATGQVLTRISGKHSNVHVAGGAATAYQHDATMLANGTISVFDNGGSPKVHSQSRGLIVGISPGSQTETVLAQFDHPTPPLSSSSQGSVQVLENGSVFVGWGAEPFFSEFNSAGQLLFDAHMHGTYETYRAFRFPWAGEPTTPPAIAASTAAKGATTVFASWNGDTQTASWRVLAGPSAQQLTPVAGVPRSGFETAIPTPAAERYVAVQALSASGALLGTSATIRG